MDDDLLSRIRLEGGVPRHVAVIMDGNGRWARARGLPRYRGHAEGMKSVREVVEVAIEAGVENLTLFAFSQENWNRPAPEVSALMSLLQMYAARERDELKAKGVEVRVFGDLDRLAAGPRKAIRAIERVTAGGQALRLNLMISYGGRAELVRAAQRLAQRVADGALAVQEIDEQALAGELYAPELPDPDLLIRTSGEQRISNFMLWQLAYTEIFISPVLWPDFRRDQLFEAILDFQQRDRRFGRVSSAV